MFRFALGMAAGSLLSWVWIRFERRRLVEEVQYLRARLSDEMQWQQILGSSLYPEDDDLD